MRWMIQGSNLIRGKRHFSSPKCPDQLWSQLSLIFTRHQDYFRRRKLVRVWCSCLPPSTAKVKNKWWYTSKMT
jgi:hypothetical protein